MLKPVIAHRWDLAPAKAQALQRDLARRILLEDAHGPWQTVAGVDVSVKQDRARAAVVVFSYPSMEEITHATAERAVAFPYIPGLLSFREAPVVLEALEHLEILPDVLLFDGQGYAHPRRLGIASHIGVILDHPAVGCAKSRLWGYCGDLPPERGSQVPLMDGEEIIGMVVRTRTGVKPVYVSPGHRVSFQSAVELVLHCTKGFRLPEPIRRAHRVAGL